jgi:hypothetical protein
MMDEEMKKELLDIAEAFDYFNDIYKNESLALELTKFYFGNPY